MSLPYAAIGVGMLTVPPLTQLLLHTYDWRLTHHILGGSVLLLLPPVMLLPLARMTAGSPAWRRGRGIAAHHAGRIWTIGRALPTSAFWGLFVAYFATSVAPTASCPIRWPIWSSAASTQWQRLVHSGSREPCLRLASSQ